LHSTVGTGTVLIYIRYINNTSIYSTRLTATISSFPTVCAELLLIFYGSGTSFSLNISFVRGLQKFFWILVSTRRLAALLWIRIRSDPELWPDCIWIWNNYTGSGSDHQEICVIANFSSKWFHFAFVAYLYFPRIYLKCIKSLAEVPISTVLLKFANFFVGLA
jgi:hypothetical protein